MDIILITLISLICIAFLWILSSMGVIANDKSKKGLLGILGHNEELIRDKATGESFKESVYTVDDYFRNKEYGKAKDLIKQKIGESSKKTLLQKLGLKKWEDPLIEYDYSTLAFVTAKQGNIDEAVGYLQEAVEVIRKTDRSPEDKAGAL
jgi:hypothetical protein